MSDYIPDSIENLHAWADNLHSEIALQASDLGLAAPEVTAFQTLIAPIRDQAADALQKEDDLNTVTGQLRAYLAANRPDIRQTVNSIKALASYNTGIGTALGIVGSSATLDPATYQPELKAVAQAGHVRLMGKKLGADAVNIYTRLQGQIPWRLLVGQRLRFPFYDDTPLVNPAIPEAREYRAIGVKADQEIGQPSDIVTAAFAG